MLSALSNGNKPVTRYLIGRRDPPHRRPRTELVHPGVSLELGSVHPQTPVSLPRTAVCPGKNRMLGCDNRKQSC